MRQSVSVEHTDIGQNKGQDLFGLSGLNGPRAFEGGMPVFDFDTYQDVGITELYMPYIRHDDQYQTVANLTWMKGQHNLRFGTDIYFQGLNHTQPEFTGDNFGARGGFRFRGGPTQLPGGAVGEQLQCVGSVSARSAGSTRSTERDSGPVYDANAELQLLRARSMAGEQSPDRFIRQRATNTSRFRRESIEGSSATTPTRT